MTRPSLDSDIIGDRVVRDETVDLPMFAAQREASPEVSRNEAPGAGQSARRKARERAHAKLDATYARIVQVLTAYPNGLTRKEMAELSGINVNTINARCAELRDKDQTPEYPDWRLYTEGRRNGESIVKLARLRPHSHEE